MSNFSTNLRELCRTRRSVSSVCRDIGLNRQQFERYLQGQSQPSSHNTYLICQYFGVEEASLFLPPREFNARVSQLSADLTVPGVFQELFPGNLNVLRNYVGLYHTYFINITWPSLIQCGLCLVREENNLIRTRYLGRAQDPSSRQTYRSRFHGMMSFQGDAIFVLERGSGAADAMAQTILTPSEAHRSTYVTGLTMAMAWRPYRTPFSSRVIWKKQKNTYDYRDAARKCGLYRPNSMSLDPVVRSFFEHPGEGILRL